MFTQGRIIFAITFVVIFAITIAIMYRKDLKLHKIYYKGSSWILIAFIGFISILFAIKLFLKD